MRAKVEDSTQESKVLRALLGGMRHHRELWHTLTTSDQDDPFTKKTNKTAKGVLMA